MGRAKASQLSTVVSLVIGGVLIIGALAVVLLIGDLSRQAFWILRVAVSIGAAFAAAGVLGSVEIQGQVANLSIKAGGPVALAVIVYLLNPPQVVQRIL